MQLLSTTRARLTAISLAYLLLASIFATVKLDQDEFSIIKEPYELLGGDYTKGYLRDGNYRKALETIAKSYFFYWQYRPLFSPIISEEHKTLFAEEEKRFGYVKPESVAPADPDALAAYSSRLIVPEPDRLYSHGSGKALLPALLTIPQLALVSLVSDGQDLLRLQHSYNYHPLFVLTRIVQILSGLLTILLLFYIVRKEFDEKLAISAAAICAFFPISVQYFPNLHHDSIVVPFLLAATYLFLKGRFLAGGAAFGLALAAKNTAIFMVPPLFLYIVWKSCECHAENGSGPGLRYLRRRTRELAVFGIVALVTLSPFANPVSFINEILTPITHREFDPRGEKVDNWWLASTLESDGTSVNRSTVRPDVLLVQKVMGAGNVTFFFILLAVSLCFQSRLRELSKISLLMLLMTLLHGLVFGSALVYRQLMFVPFFAILCADLLTGKSRNVLAGFLLLISVLYSLDPISTNTTYGAVNQEGLVESAARWFSAQPANP